MNNNETTALATIVPGKLEEWGQAIEVTKKGIVFTGEDLGKIPPSTIIDLIKRLATIETACSFGVGDLANFLVGMKGKDLLEIASATGISAADLRRTSSTCTRIPYAQRDEQLHFDFPAEAAKSKADDPAKWLALTTSEHLDRKRLKRSVELGRLATDGDLNPEIEENDGGTKSFGGAVNRIVVFNGELERAGYYNEKTPEDLFELSADLLPVVKVWAGLVKRFKGKLPEDLEQEFAQQMAEVVA